MTLRTDLPDGPPISHQARDCYEITNGITEDWADDDNLSAMVAAYEIDDLPFTVQRFPAGETNTHEMEGA